jgi:hypothetical protein
MYPRIGRVDNYLDWRSAIGASDDAFTEDFDDGFAIVSDAWDDAIEYVELSWKSWLAHVGVALGQ